MSAIEIPNFFEAGGLFDGAAAPASGSPIIFAEGFQAYDPATTPLAPVGGFTRVLSGTYVLIMDQPIDGGEGCVFVQKFLQPPLPNVAIPAANIFQDGKIGVGDSANDAAEGIDFTFYVAVLRVKYGPNLTAS